MRVSPDTRDQPVRKFRIETDALSKKREIKVRLLSWGSVLSLIAITVLVFVFRFLGLLGADSPARWLVVLALLGAVLGAYIEAARLGMRRAKRRMLFVLSDKEFIRKRSGWPDDRIAFSEIHALYDGPGGLVVESTEPLRRISVPREVNGFKDIRAELAKQHSFAAQAKPPRTKLSGTGLVVWIVTILSWAALIFIIYKVMQLR
jgi:hypothetical protein